MRFLVDFNEIENGGRIWADLDDAPFFFEGDLQAGREVQLFDGAGHWCVGIITDVDLDRRLVRLRIDWQTWRSERYPSIAQDFRSPPARYRARFATSERASTA